MKTSLWKNILSVITIIITLLYISPFIWLLIQSFQTNYELMSIPPRFWPHWENPLINYQSVLTGEVFGYYKWAVPEAVFWIPRSILNSLVIATASSLFALFTAAWAAYTISRIKFRGRDRIMILLLVLRMFPIFVIIIPLLMLLSLFQLVGTYLGLILPYVAILLPYNIWMLNAYFQVIPMDIDDSAKVDGANRWQIIHKIILPLCGPGLVAVFLFNFISCWNDFFLASIVTRSPDTYTLPVVIAMFTGHLMMTPWDLMLASAVLGAIPTAILALIFQKYLVSGLVAGAVKG